MANNKIQLANGLVLLDLTADTVDAEHLAEGYTAHDCTGAIITGTMAGGGGPTANDAILTVTAPAGATITAAKGAVTIVPTMWTAAADSNLETALFIIEAADFDANTPWTVSVTSGGNTVTGKVTIDSAKQYNLNLSAYKGVLYSGSYDPDIAHEFVIYNRAVVTDEVGYINVRCAGGAQREGGVQFGPLVLGATYTFSVQNANSSYNIHYAGGANLTAVSRVASMALNTGDTDVAAGGSATLILDTSSLAGRTGYIYAWAYFTYAWSSARNYNRILRVEAT